MNEERELRNLQEAFPGIYVREDGGFLLQRPFDMRWEPGDVESNLTHDPGAIYEKNIDGRVCIRGGDYGHNATRLKLSQIQALADYITAVDSTAAAKRVREEREAPSTPAPYPQDLPEGVQQESDALARAARIANDLAEMVGLPRRVLRALVPDGVQVCLAENGRQWALIEGRWHLVVDSGDDDGHSSDCAVHNEPALPKGDCTCGLAPPRVLPSTPAEMKANESLFAGQRSADEAAGCPHHGDKAEDAGWYWHASSDEERYTIGPCDSREEVIEEAIESECGLSPDMKMYSFVITEARQDLVDLARYIDVDDMVDRWLDGSLSDIGDPDDGAAIIDHIKTDQWGALQDQLQKAAREWQAEQKITIKPWIFTDQRNSETVRRLITPEGAKTFKPWTEIPDGAFARDRISMKADGDHYFCIAAEWYGPAPEGVVEPAQSASSNPALSDGEASNEQSQQPQPPQGEGDAGVVCSVPGCRIHGALGTGEEEINGGSFILADETDLQASTVQNDPGINPILDTITGEFKTGEQRASEMVDQANAAMAEEETVDA
jgi:hypothetical protein